MRISPDEKGEYFLVITINRLGDAGMRYVICMRAEDTWSEPDPIRTADILLIDVQNGNSVRKVATTHTWNVQQGCMAQWLGPDF